MSVHAQNVVEKDSPLRRAAILILVLGSDVAREVFPRLRESEIHLLGEAAATLGEVEPGEVVRVLHEFRRAFHGRNLPLKGTGRLFQLMVERALGEERARDLLGAEPTADPYVVCAAIDPELLAGVLQQEHPQTTAIVLASLEPGRAGDILQHLDSERAGDVIYRMAHLGTLSDEVKVDVGNTLLAELQAMGTLRGAAKIDGQRLAVEVTKKLPADMSDEILDGLEESDAEFASTIRSQLFTFEDLAKLDSRTMQRLLREVDSRRLMIAMKGTPPEVHESVFSAMSKRAAEMLREDLEASPPVRIADVEEAQNEVLEIAFRLEGEGALALPRGGGREMV